MSHLSTRELSRRFVAADGTSVQALDGTSIEIPSGTFVSTSLPRPAAGASTLTTSAAPPPASSAGNAFGRVVAMAGLPVISTVAKALPE